MSTLWSIPAHRWWFCANHPPRWPGLTRNRATTPPRTIDRIEIGGIAVYDVPAMVLPDEALAKNLLGVSFLSRLKRYEYANGRLLLEQ